MENGKELWRKAPRPCGEATAVNSDESHHQTCSSFGHKFGETMLETESDVGEGKRNRSQSCLVSFQFRYTKGAATVRGGGDTLQASGIRTQMMMND